MTKDLQGPVLERRLEAVHAQGRRRDDVARMALTLCGVRQAVFILAAGEEDEIRAQQALR